jgi:hypothetical protein
MRTAPEDRMIRRQFIALALTASAAVACNRYKPYAPRVVAFATGNAAYHAALDVLERHDYEIAVADEKRLLVQTKAKLDGGIKQSRITLRATADGELRIDVAGDHVKSGEQVAHRKLLEELDVLQELLARESWFNERHHDQS